MRKFILSIVLLPSISLAQERLPFVGEYVIDCGSSNQCWLEIDMPDHLEDGAFQATFTVHDRFEFSDVKCSIPVIMKYTGSELVGGFEGSAVHVADAGQGDIEVSGLPHKCGQLDGKWVAAGY